ncbi:olfactory receptor 5AR1-like [Candoia aspera]|uniref:olfactory receptor 5AR1-like n=1 Tax=Candoia aspera TaxID=51853 RepID=UPI002FD80240
MDEGNDSVITEFIFQGFTDNPKMQLVLFMVFLLVYAITVLGNLGMILLICTQPQLHKPMYYFLGNLSFVDLCCSSNIAPKMLTDLLSETKRISYSACATQLFLFSLFADTGGVLLAVMAYDRYVAICNPLLYPTVMSKKTCQQLITIAYFTGLLDSTIHTFCTFRLSFCSSNIINHFFCDEPPLLILSCTETYVNEIVIFTIYGCLEASSIGMILVSYLYILGTILRMRSTEGRHRAFSTCASHLTAVGIFHGTILYMYFRPSSSYSMDQDKWASMFYTVVIPMLNPLIYSLRNKEVKDAVSKALGNIAYSSEYYLNKEHILFKYNTIHQYKSQTLPKATLSV